MSRAVDAPALRPLRVGEVIDVAVKVYTRNAATLLKIALVVIAPVQILGALILLSSVPDPSETATTTGAFGFIPWTLVAGFGAAFLLRWVSTTLTTGACYKTIAGAYLDRAPGWKESLAFGRRRLGAMLWLAFLQGVVTLIGLIACIAPGVWLAVSYSVAMPAMLTEDVRGGRALGRAIRLVQGRWWATFGVVALGFLLTFVVEFVLSIGVELVTPAIGDVVLVVALNTAISIVTGVVVTPFQAAVATVLYFDLRVRKEAFDLELLTQRVGTPVGGAPALPPPPSSSPGWNAPEPPRAS